MPRRPIVASRPTAAVTSERLIELEWTLDRKPGPAWVGSFLAARVPGPRPPGWTNPRPVVVGNHIRVLVHDDDVEAVRSWIDASIGVANQSPAATNPEPGPFGRRRLRPLTA